jgi:DUF971 family protein
MPSSPDRAPAPNPTELVVHQQSGLLEIAFDDGQRVSIPIELMRVCSPSAEVQGHGPGQEALQTGKRHVGIVSIDPVGHYGIKPTFTDGHDSGIFTWSCLLQLGQEQESLWRDYLRRLAASGKDRDEPMQTATHACGSHH